MALRRLTQLRTYEVALTRTGLGPVAGVDEAGRGAACGPITIAACILPERTIPQLRGLTDSKQLGAGTRAALFPLVKKYALAWSVISIPAVEIDRHGIQHANVSGMRRALAALQVRPGYVLTDALRIPGLPYPQLPIIGGDASARCIAAASVLAKQSRDDLMVEMSRRYPEYGLAGHKGYSTKTHLDAVRRHGGSPEHRYSYANVAGAHQQWLDGRRHDGPWTGPGTETEGGA